MVSQGFCAYNDVGLVCAKLCKTQLGLFLPRLLDIYESYFTELAALDGSLICFFFAGVGVRVGVNIQSCLVSLL